MNAEQAWDHFVQQVMNVAGGIEEPTRAIAAGKLYAAHAVAQARAPLVEALKEAHAGLVAILTIPSASAAYDDAIGAAKDGRAAAAAALAAKETGDG
jgi:hypothetical protein